MSYSGYDWEQFLRMLMYTAPNFLCWCVAVFFCMTRRRENPRGATFLGLAVLVSFFTNALWWGWPYIVKYIGGTGFAIYGSVEYVLVGFHAISTIVFWIMIVMAVFARPIHYEYVGDLSFKD